MNKHHLVGLNVVGSIVRSFGPNPNRTDVAKVLAVVVSSLFTEEIDFAAIACGINQVVITDHDR
jgi:hypothetical protein